MSWNKIREIPAGCFESILKLKGLQLSCNQISKIPKLSLPNLTVLSMGNNQITEIPVGTLDELIRLEKLMLYENKIKKMQGLEVLTSLRELKLDNNQIEEIEGL